MTSYADIMFTPEVEQEQDLLGSKGRYAARYAAKQDEPLGMAEQQFLSSRTSLYIATVNSTGWPYVQHRGGPAGFVKILGPRTIGFLDYLGNRQVITKGNLNTDDRISVFAMDYARKARLKLQGHAQLNPIDANDPAWPNLQTDGQGQAERVMTIQITAWDWNCPQYITPRFDSAEIAALVGPELSRLQTKNAELEAELADLRADLRTRK